MKRSLSAGLVAVGCLAATLAAAQENYVISAFDAEDEAFRWSRWWGSAPQLYEFDPSVDAAASAASGSLKATVDFDLAAYGGDNQFALQGAFAEGATLDGTLYTNLVFNIRWDASSPTADDGNHGYLEYGLRNADFSQTALGGRTILASDAGTWLRIEAPIDPATPKLDTITGVWLKVWSGGGGGLTGSAVFWVDNVLLLANTNTAPPPPPSMSIAPATPGLRMAASGTGQYQRQNIRTLATDADGNMNGYSWVGASGPVSYAVTLKDFPDAAHSGFQAHLFLAPEAGMPYGAGDTSIDWNTPNIVFVQIAGNSDGTASARFMYKTNLPSGNAMLWNTDEAAGPVGTLAIISDASANGTWTVTFQNDTQVTLTTPSGAVTNVAMPAAAAELFADPMFVYVGVQPNQVANLGQSATLGEVRFTGVPTPLTETFSGDALDATRWAIVAESASGIVQVPTAARYWLDWEAPATGFVVQSSPSLAAGSWVDPGLSNVIQIGNRKTVLVPQSALPAGRTGYFRLIKP